MISPRPSIRWKEIEPIRSDCSQTGLQLLAITRQLRSSSRFAAAAAAPPPPPPPPLVAVEGITRRMSLVELGTIRMAREKKITMIKKKRKKKKNGMKAAPQPLWLCLCFCWQRHLNCSAAALKSYKLLVNPSGMIVWHRCRSQTAPEQQQTTRKRKKKPNKTNEIKIGFDLSVGMPSLRSGIETGSNRNDK